MHKAAVNYLYVRRHHVVRHGKRWAGLTCDTTAFLPEMRIKLTLIGSTITTVNMLNCKVHHGTTNLKTRALRTTETPDGRSTFPCPCKIRKYTSDLYGAAS